MWSRLAKWYRELDEEQQRVLQHPELAASLAPGYRRHFAMRMAEMSAIERQQMLAFTRKHRGWRTYGAIVGVLALFTLAGLAGGMVFPEKGMLPPVIIANAVGIAFAVAFFGAWFNYRKMARKGKWLGFGLAGWSIFAGLMGIAFHAWLNGGSLHEELAARGPTVIAVCLAGCVLFALPLAMIGLVRNQQYETLTAKLELDAERERTARELSESQLRLLRAQIEPHFLFNTLGAVQQLAEKGAPRAAALTASLIDFLRASLAGMRDERVTLRAEFGLLDAYLTVMRTRIGERLRYRLDLPAELAGISMPGMMLLTLVENAIKHGIEPSLRGGAIEVSATRQLLDPGRGNEGVLRIRVQDSGVGMSAAPGAGDGIANIRKRLQLAYGDAARLELRDADDGGVIADILLPAGDGA